ncbi:hypothetical protein DPMN_057850 [Dreissena polymorpha]|uniref:Endonuclease/exonuclease/phosphatase domain-containing protein n=1 Tax=Dreissena polymorpha TaxID=45954 RepID=A0A9D4HEV9_DREPO|nr:hypothetical protein DPMN_057850 [Dreissena polymorpha]
MGIAIHSNPITYNIIVGYKPPKFPVQMFLQSLQTQIINLQNLIILGDFNQTGNTGIFNRFLQENSIRQYITTPTHILGDTLDLIISNLPDLHSITKAVPYTDHHLVAVKLDNPCNGN